MKFLYCLPWFLTSELNGCFRPDQPDSLPEAVLKFRQGVGRLIRSRSDRGIIVLLDRRVLTKNYGRLFLDSLPYRFEQM